MKKRFSRILALVIVALLAVTLVPTALAGECTHDDSSQVESLGIHDLGNGTHAQVMHCLLCNAKFFVNVQYHHDNNHDGSCDVCGAGMGGGPVTPTDPSTPADPPAPEPEAPPKPEVTAKCTHAGYKRIRQDVGNANSHRLICSHCGAPWSWEAHDWHISADGKTEVCSLCGASRDLPTPAELLNTPETQPEENQPEENQPEEAKPAENQPEEAKPAEEEKPATADAPQQETAVQESSGQTTIPADSAPDENVLTQKDFDRINADTGCYCNHPYTGERVRCD